MKFAQPYNFKSYLLPLFNPFLLGDSIILKKIFVRLDNDTLHSTSFFMIIDCCCPTKSPLIYWTPLGY